jgi:AAA ATPase domain/Adenylate and Guanylate cyclase catalytic domain
VFEGHRIVCEGSQRAIRAGREIVHAVKALNTRLDAERRVRLAVRVGIHTGLVVVGEVGTGGSAEHLALGETPNIAARIQGLAQPDTVVMSEATGRLAQGYFICRDLGPHRVKGVDTAVPLYEVLDESGVQSRLDTASAEGLTPLVGREPELTLLLERWAQARDGLGQIVMLSGEAGIGKSRLVQAFRGQLTREAHLAWECRGSPYHQHSALYPIIAPLGRARPGGGVLVPTRSHDCRQSAGEGAGTPGRHEPWTTLAARREVSRSSRVAHANPSVVHGGIRHRRLARVCRAARQCRATARPSYRLR